MIDRKLAGKPPATHLPKGAIDTQIHAYVDGFPALPGGPGLPPAPLPTPAMYREVMEWLGLERVVVTQGNAHQADNACLLAAIAEFGNIARGVAVITPDTTDAQIEALSNAGVVGARIMDLKGGAVGLEHLETIDAMAANVGWMVAVQFDGSALPELASRLDRMRSRWVLDHHGKIFSGATQTHFNVIRRLLDGGNMWFKFAACYESSRLGGPLYQDIADVARKVAAHAPERVIWGTNWPHNLAQTTADYPDDGALLDLALEWMGDEQSQRLALVANPEALFGFDS